MEKSRERKRVGIASMLDKSEIKEYFDTFFILVLGIEFVIFVALLCFKVSHYTPFILY